MAIYDAPMNLERLERDAASAVAAAATSEALAQVSAEHLGRRSALALAHRELGGMEPEERKAAGKALSEARARVEALVEGRARELAEQDRRAMLEIDRLDLTEAPLRREARGHLHLVTQTRRALEDVFVAMGFIVVEGPEVESDWRNFEALNIPPAHPARSMWDTFYLDIDPPGSLLLRTHTSPVQIRLMEAGEPPFHAVMPGRTYRRETRDASHLAVFHQLEGLVVDRGISFGDLAGTVEAFVAEYFGADIRARLRPGYFPFTEPSAEVDVTCTICRGSGCRTCSGTGWLELAGCGMVDPAVFAAVGIDAEEWSGFAFGFGIDRCAQMRHGISDLRALDGNDVRFSRQF